MRNPFLDRDNDHKIGKSGRMSEKRTARRVGAQLTPSSGAASQKGDMKLGRVLIEAKSTINDSISIKLDWLAKISREALETNKKPALSVTFVTEAGHPKRFGRWVMIEEDVFKEMCQ